MEMTGDELRARIDQLGLRYTEAAEQLGLSLAGLHHQMRDMRRVSHHTRDNPQLSRTREAAQTGAPELKTSNRTSNPQLFPPGAILAWSREEETHAPRIGDSDLGSIAERHDIPVSEIEQIRTRLNEGALSYWYLRDKETLVQRQLSYPKIKKELTQLDERIGKLYSSLNNCSDEATFLFDYVEEIVRSEISTHDTSSFGHALH